MTEKTSWYQAVPKAELHLHLEGAIPLETLWELVLKYGGDQEVPDLAALEQKFEYRDFPHFIDIWVWKNQFIREYEDFTFLAEAFARDLVSQNIRYVETFYSPPDFARFGLTIQEITAAIRKGLDRVPAVKVYLIPDLVRDFGPEQAGVSLQKVNEVRELGIPGVGIGGSEQLFPPEPFAAVYEEARRLGFHTTAHAGEVVGAESVWGAVNSLHVDRIGHATHAEEDERLLDFLAEEQIPLELCPISNVCTGSVSSYEQHPVRRYFDRGLKISINTDDPKMFGNSLAEEYRRLVEIMGFTTEDIRKVLLQTIDASWQSEEEKHSLRQEFINSPDW
ncbi:MAG: adenosine deaminase [Anaerolineales bacterium]|nr:adenosine deaminase [Anaerolineales bacterium]